MEMLPIMLRGRRLLFLLFGPMVLSACALIADLGDRTLGDPNATPNQQDGSKPGDNEDDNPPDDEDSSTKKDVEEPPLPSYCNGITIYASFDGKLTGDVGGANVVTIGGVTQSTAGKFGGAISLQRDNSTVDTQAAGASQYLLSTTANPFPEKIGSLSLWYRPVTDATIPVLYRPVANLPDAGALKTAGLSYYLRNDVGDVFGLHEKSGPAQAQILAFPVVSRTPFLRPADFNHFFTAWRQDTAPTAFMAINGGEGEVFNGAGGTFPDAGDDAGELANPYRGFSSKPWASEGAPIALRLGGFGTNSPDGLIDDLVVWNRVLTFEEADAVYKAGKPVGEVCKLK